jgi:hypothetical protein
MVSPDLIIGTSIRRTQVQTLAGKRISGGLDAKNLADEPSCARRCIRQHPAGDIDFDGSVVEVDIGHEGERVDVRRLTQGDAANLERTSIAVVDSPNRDVVSGYLRCVVEREFELAVRRGGVGDD